MQITVHALLQTFTQGTSNVLYTVVLLAIDQTDCILLLRSEYSHMGWFQFYKGDNVNLNSEGSSSCSKKHTICFPGPGCSKLTTSLVNVSLKFQTLISEICQYFLLKNERSFCIAKASLIFSTKNFSVFGYKVVKHLTS